MFGTVPHRFAVAVCFALATSASGAQSLSRASDSILRNTFEAPDAGPYNDHDAARFLAQATFGPTLTDIQDLRQKGYQGWFDEQVDAQLTPPTHAMDYINWLNSIASTDYYYGRIESWWLGALGGPDPANFNVIHKDQLRQRVAFALSQIFVTSDKSFALSGQPYGLSSYYDVLTDDAFSNFRTLLQDVTLSPAMGVYLSMLGNQKPDPVKNIRPDENYAREVMQLFSVGLVQLNLDGTPVLVNGQQVPTYDQNTVKGFAHVFTGWTYPTCDAQSWSWCTVLTPSTPDGWISPMVPVESYHDSANSKQLLVYPGVALPGGILPAGGDAQGDLNAALDNIFYHPNVGPFISKQLIQRLVTSNPTQAYVARVASVFNDNGSGVRGDLKAVVKAILFDQEARWGQWTMPSTFGKLREPLIRITHLWRTLGARHYCGTGDELNPYRYIEWFPDMEFGQAALRSPSVFNFYYPDFAPPGEVLDAGLVAPEMQLNTDAWITSMMNGLQARLFYRIAGIGCNAGTGYVMIDPAAEAVYAADPKALIDRYDLLFMSGQMSPLMRTTLINYLATIPASSATQRVKYALFLILTSPEYVIQQ